MTTAGEWQKPSPAIFFGVTIEKGSLNKALGINTSTIGTLSLNK